MVLNFYMDLHHDIDPDPDLFFDNPEVVFIRIRIRVFKLILPMILLLDSNLVHAMDPDLDYILIGYCSGFNPNRIAGGQKIREKFLCFHHDNLKA